MKRWCLLFILLPFALLAAELGSSPVRDEARRILANVQSTHYSHRTTVDEVAGRYDLDCSGLATLILKKVAPAQLRAVSRESTKSHPRAFEFYDTFIAAATNAQAAGWVRVPHLVEARPGDFIAWRKNQIVPGESTGHIVVVDEIPVRETSGTVRVVVIDSTSSPHANDTRKSGINGVGRGVMWFTVNDAGEPVGTMRKDQNDKPRTASPIAIGRVVTKP